MWFSYHLVLNFRTSSVSWFFVLYMILQLKYNIEIKAYELQVWEGNQSIKIEKVKLHKDLGWALKAVKRSNGIWWVAQENMVTKWGRKLCNYYFYIVKSIIFCSAEAWIITESDKRKIMALELIRRSTCMLLKDRICSERIRTMITYNNYILFWMRFKKDNEFGLDIWEEWRLKDYPNNISVDISNKHCNE